MAQSPNVRGLHRQARFDYHPWRQCSLHGLNLHVFRGLPQEVTFRSHMPSSSQKVKSGMGNPDWNVSMVDIHLLKLLWVYCPACRSEGMGPSRQTDGQSNPNKWLASRKIWSAEKLETLPACTKPRTSHHWSSGGVRSPKRSAGQSSLKGRARAIVNQTNVGRVSKATLPKLLRDGVGRI